MGEPQQYNRKEFISRVGTFFVLIGIGMLILFLLSEQAGGTNFDYFCWSTILFVIGFVLRSQYKRPAGPAHGRFSIFQKIKRDKKE